MKLYFTLWIILFMLDTNAKTVAIIDMPISRNYLSPQLSKKVQKIYNMSNPAETFKNCDGIVENFEKFFSYSLLGQYDKLNSLKYLNQFESFAYQIHGYHILGLVAHNTNHQIYFIGVNPPISKKYLRKIDQYINTDLEEEFIFIKKHLIKIKPDFVNISGSKSIDDNLFFLKENKINDITAMKYSNRIFKKWSMFWKQLISSLPNTTFVVSAGNGGSDWQSDKVEFNSISIKATTPANIKLDNIIVVGSKHLGKLSPFSSYGEVVDAYENGEKVISYIPCGTKNTLRLTGTSQATAIRTNRLLRAK
ncbi:MAG: S8 family serine peptidase [Flavobacteriaceae bacterium]|nr:S8 family serine peptidase [Flavobacteriaceae bacterium]